MKKFITALQKGTILFAGILSSMATFDANYHEHNIKLFIIMFCLSILCFTAYEIMGE